MRSKAIVLHGNAMKKTRRTRSVLFSIWIHINSHNSANSELSDAWIKTSVSPLWRSFIDFFENALCHDKNKMSILLRSDSYGWSHLKTNSWNLCCYHLEKFRWRFNERVLLKFEIMQILQSHLWLSSKTYTN